MNLKYNSRSKSVNANDDIVQNEIIDKVWGFFSWDVIGWETD